MLLSKIFGNQKLFLGLIFTNFLLININSVVLAENDLKSIEPPQEIAQITSIEALEDVSPDDFYFHALQNLIERYGLIVGYPDRTFRGEQNLSRYEFIAHLTSALEILAPFDIFLTQPHARVPEEVFFIRDILPTDYAYEAIRRLVEGYGVYLLYPDQTFRGTQAITNQELYQYLNQAFGLNYSLDIPVKTVTRGEFIVILEEILNNIIETEIYL